MREARLQAVRPVLYASAIQRGFEVVFEPDKSLDPKLVFPAVEGQTSRLPFEIRNAVDAPAFEVRCDWELGREIELDANFRLASLKQAADRKEEKLTYEKGVIKLGDSDGFGFHDDWKYSRSSRSTHLEILGGKSKPINFPSELLYQMVCFCLLKAERQQIYNEYIPSKDVPLKLWITCRAPSGEKIVKQFLFQISFGFSRYIGPDGKVSSRGQLPSDWSAIKVFGTISTKTVEDVVLVNPSFNELLSAVLKSVAKYMFAVIRIP